MRSVLVAVSFVALLVSTRANADSTPLERFERRVGKYVSSAFDSLDKGKNMCVCLGGGAAEDIHAAGVLTEFVLGLSGVRRVRVRCNVRRFDQNDNALSSTFCDDWAPLAK